MTVGLNIMDRFELLRLIFRSRDQALVSTGGMEEILIIENTSFPTKLDIPEAIRNPHNNYGIIPGTYIKRKAVLRSFNSDVYGTLWKFFLE
jgi:hypothetical protein